MIYHDFRALFSILVITSFVSFISPFPAAAKITPKKLPPEKEHKILIIKKGDTLWELSEICYKNCKLWPRFKEFNVITNPHWIYPGERLAVSIEDAKKIEQALGKRVVEVKEEEAEKLARMKAIEEAIKAEKQRVAELQEKLRLEQEERLKKAQAEEEAKRSLVTKLASERFASLIKEMEEIKKEQAKKEEEINALQEQTYALKTEGIMLEKFATELREKLSQSDAEVEEISCQVAEIKSESQGIKGLAHFLALGIACGIILISQSQ